MNWFGSSHEEQRYLSIESIVDADKLYDEKEGTVFQMDSYLGAEQEILTKNTFGILNLIADLGGLTYLVFIISTWLI